MSKALYIGWHNLIKTALPKGMAILALLLVVTFIPVEVEAQAGGISASQIVSLTNATRSGVGVSTLAVSSQLQQSAQLKAQDMADKGYFAHADAQGRRLGYWMSVTGYNYKSAGENLAMGFETAQGAINGWKNSPSHYANMIKPEYQEIGVGVATGLYEGELTIFVVQHFGEPKNLVLPVSEEVAIEVAPMFEVVPAPAIPAPVTSVINPAPVAPAQPVTVVAPAPVASGLPEFTLISPVLAFEPMLSWEPATPTMTTVDYDPISTDLAVLLVIVSILTMASLYVEIWDREAVKKWLTKYLGAADPLA